MPVLDKPLRELKTYMGMTPCPKDFDEFWDERVARVRAIKPSYRVEKADFTAPKGTITEDLFFTAEDGSEIYAMVVRPDDEEKHPVLFQFHGLGGNVGDYSGKLKWTVAGVVTVSLDCRGQAGRSSDNTARKGGRANGHIVRGVDGGRENLYYTSVFTDIVQLVELIKTMPYANTDKMCAYGGSQGGALTVVCGALCGKDIKAIAPEFPYLSDYKRVYDMDMIERAYEDIKQYIRAFLPEDGERDEFWTLLGYIDIQNFAKRITADVYWYTGLVDNVCPPSSQFACYNKITANKKMFIASNYGHECCKQWWDAAYCFLLEYLK